MTDQPSLRQRVARAIHRYDNHHALSGNDMPSKHHYGEADFVLAELRAELAASAVVPAADRAALRDRIAGRLDEAFQSFDPERTEDAQLSGYLADALLAALPAPADRAAVLRELADLAEESDGHITMQELRRMARGAESAVVDRVAAETPPAETLAAAVASCPGYETSPNPCRCPCYGCKHHCAAHNPGHGPAVVAQPGKDTETRIVAYRSKGGRLLRCLSHAPDQDVIDSGDFRPVTSEDLPDGGLCTYPLPNDLCGVDVLIPQQPKEA